MDVKHQVPKHKDVNEREVNRPRKLLLDTWYRLEQGACLTMLLRGDSTKAEDFAQGVCSCGTKKTRGDDQGYWTDNSGDGGRTAKLCQLGRKIEVGTQVSR